MNICSGRLYVKIPGSIPSVSQHGGLAVPKSLIPVPKTHSEAALYHVTIATKPPFIKLIIYNHTDRGMNNPIIGSIYSHIVGFVVIVFLKST